MQQCTYETNDDVNIDNDNKFELSGKYSLRITESVAERPDMVKIFIHSGKQIYTVTRITATSFVYTHVWSMQL